MPQSNAQSIQTEAKMERRPHPPEEARAIIILGWICTPLYIISSFITLCTWHPLIALSRRISPTAFHEWFIAFGNRILQLCFLLTGGKIKFAGKENIPEEGPAIVVSNHQSLFDIPLLIWLLRGHNTKFIAKKSLAYGIPSASYVLRTNGHALIDRGDPQQAAQEIRAVAEKARLNGGTVVIFPEGTRARDGVLKKFKPGGMKVLTNELPNAPVVPVSISGAWRIMRYGFFPVPFGIEIVCTVHKPIRQSDHNEQRIIEECELIISKALSHSA